MGALWIRILERKKKMHLAFYSCELELNFSAIKGNLNGINPEIRVQQLWKRFTCGLHTRN
jgi:hypothetical protein